MFSKKQKKEHREWQREVKKANENRARLLIAALHDRLFNMGGGAIPEDWLDQIERTFWPKQKRGRPPLPAAEIWKLDVASEAITAWYEAKGKKRGFLTRQYQEIADKHSKMGRALTLKKVEGIFKDYAIRAIARAADQRLEARNQKNALARQAGVEASRDEIVETVRKNRRVRRRKSARFIGG